MEKRNFDLEQFRVGETSTVYYIPEFISKEEETKLLENLYERSKNAWKEVKGRRLQNWGGLPHPKGMVVSKIPDYFDAILNKLFEYERLGGERANHILVNEYLAGGGIMAHEDGPLYYPEAAILSLENYIMMDIYKKPSSEDILTMESQENRSSQTETQLSSVVNHLQEKEFSILLEPRSLLLFLDHVYLHRLHSIAFRNEDCVDEKVVNLKSLTCNQEPSNSTITVGSIIPRKKRVSLTIRRVKKVLKTSIRL